MVSHCLKVLRCQAAAIKLKDGAASPGELAASAHFLLAFSASPALREESVAACQQWPSWQCRLCPPSSPSPYSPTVSSVVCGAGHEWPRCLLTQVRGRTL